MNNHFYVAFENDVQQEYQTDGKTVEAVWQERDLGVIITKDMKASQQCRKAHLKANKVLGIINRTVQYKSREVLLKLYKSLVRPQLEFCTAAWSPYYKKDKELLERSTEFMDIGRTKSQSQSDRSV